MESARDLANFLTKARAIGDTPERTKLYQEMTKFIIAYALIGYRRHPLITYNTWKYIDRDRCRCSNARASEIDLLILLICIPPPAAIIRVFGCHWVSPAGTSSLGPRSCPYFAILFHILTSVGD